MVTFGSNFRAGGDETVERVDGWVGRFSSNGTIGVADDWDGKRGTNSKDVFL